MHEGFKTHLLNENGKLRAKLVGEKFDNLLTELKEIGAADGRYGAIVATKLEEACFFAKKSIATKTEFQE